MFHALLLLIPIFIFVTMSITSNYLQIFISYSLSVNLRSCHRHQTVPLCYAVLYTCKSPKLSQLKSAVTRVSLIALCFRTFFGVLIFTALHKHRDLQTSQQLRLDRKSNSLPDMWPRADANCVLCQPLQHISLQTLTLLFTPPTTNIKYLPQLYSTRKIL